MNTREKVLRDALKCVNGEREKQYGSPEDNFERIARLWSAYLTNEYGEETYVDSSDVAKMMILFKIGRTQGPADKLDNYVDILGYGACAAEIFENPNEEFVTQPVTEEDEKVRTTSQLKRDILNIKNTILDTIQEMNVSCPTRRKLGLVFDWSKCESDNEEMEAFLDRLASDIINGLVDFKDATILADEKAKEINKKRNEEKK